MTPAVEEVRHNRQKDHTDRPEHFETCVDYRPWPAACNIANCV